MSDLVDPNTGALLDFDPRHGDSPGAWRARRGYGRTGIGGGRQKWGRRIQLVTPNSGLPASGAPWLKQVKQSANLISTEDVGEGQPVFIEVRFAAPISGIGEGAASTQQPNFFSRIAPNAYGNVPTLELKFTVRRSIDPASVPTVDEYRVPLGTDVNLNGLEDSFGGDIFPCRQLDLDVEMLGPPDISIWVEAIASIVEKPSRLDQLTGYTFARVLAPPLIGNVPGLLVPRRIGVVQRIFINTSTNADLYLGWGTLDPTVFPSIVLPRNMFAQYETPIGGYNGPVTGVFIGNPAHDGAAVVTEGTYDQQ